MRKALIFEIFDARLVGQKNRKNVGHWDSTLNPVFPTKSLSQGVPGWDSLGQKDPIFERIL